MESVQAMTFRLKQTGDTIVEVMIAAAIAGMVLVGAYSAANRSSLQIRNAQEHSEAQKFAVAAVENLNVLIKANPTWLVAATPVTPFCINGTPAAFASGGAVATTFAEAQLPSSTYSTAADCQKGNGRYHIVTERSTVSPDIFTVHVIWDGVTGTKQMENIVYKVRIDS